YELIQLEVDSRARRWDLASHSPEEVLLDCRLESGPRMRVSAWDPVIARAVYIEGVFEPNELSFIGETVKPGMTVIDIGANIGVHALTMAQCVGSTGMVH